MDNDSRIDHAMRSAIFMLRLVEQKTADYLPADIMQELTAAIDSVVSEVRTPVAPIW